MERLTEKINYLEKAKKAIEQEESKETAGNEILLKILKEEPDTIMSFLQSHKIETLDDLHRLAEKTKKRRSNNIHRQHELNAKLKKYSNIEINRIEELLKMPSCSFVLYVGKKKLAKRREFEQFLSSTVEI